MTDGRMSQASGMKLMLSLLLVLVALFIGCKAEVLDGGSRVREDAGGRPEASIDASIDASSSRSGDRDFGEGCTTTAECGVGLECLPFAVHREDGSCEEVSMMCTRGCDDARDCEGLEGSPMCFRGCGADFVCGKTSPDASDAITFTIEDAPEPLTSSANDPLFSLTVTEITPARTYRMSDMAVVVEPAGEAGNIVPCTHDDANGDGNLEVGEALHCVEPASDIYRATHVGKTIAISLVERIEAGSYTTRGHGSWAPAN